LWAKCGGSQFKWLFFGCHPDADLRQKDQYQTQRVEPLARFSLAHHDPSLRPDKEHRDSTQDDNAKMVMVEMKAYFYSGQREPAESAVNNLEFKEGPKTKKAAQVSAASDTRIPFRYLA
jgi:hypothetical protein